MPLDTCAIQSPFQNNILKTCRAIPFGHVMSYGELAECAGYPRAARAVGNAMAANPIPIVIPCHRVVAAQGGLGGYSIGLSYKEKLLTHEGVSIG